MPKRTDIESILLIGAGPIIIGQACEFDYSGTQALKALKEEGYRVILVNSNPATIMTDPGFADRTYIEPITTDIVEKIIAKERPDAILPTLGGQTALNLAIDLAEKGILERYGVEMIGAKIDSIKKAEDRDLFKEAMRRIGLDLPRSGYARSMRDAMRIQKRLEFSGDHPRLAHARRQRRQFRVRSRRFQRSRAGRFEHFSRARSVDRRIGARLERVRARGDARSQGQRGDHLLHRELRSRWVSIPAIRSRSRRRKPSRTKSTRSCATPRSG